jgi:hypothetical protein
MSASFAVVGPVGLVGNALALSTNSRPAPLPPPSPARGSDLNYTRGTLDFDFLKDVEPVAQLPNNPLLIVARKAVPANNLKKPIAWPKANQDKVSVGTSGVGGAHRGRALPERHWGLFQFVPIVVRFRLRGTASNSLSLPSTALGSIPAPSCATSASHPKRSSRIASWPGHGLLQSGARRSHLGLQA